MYGLTTIESVWNVCREKRKINYGKSVKPFYWVTTQPTLNLNCTVGIKLP
jgi:hypothetical protein